VREYYSFGDPLGQGHCGMVHKVGCARYTIAQPTMTDGVWMDKGVDGKLCWGCVI
jgi:hypothetical protein